MPLKNNAAARTTDCHPERRHWAKGLCKQCYNADYDRRNRERKNATARRWAANNPQRRLEVRRKYLYGVTPEYVAERIEEQGGACAVCQTGDPGHLDHNHETGFPRGMLCGSCNRALGLFAEDAERLFSAIVYLQEWDDRAVQVEPNSGRRVDGLD